MSLRPDEDDEDEEDAEEDEEEEDEAYELVLSKALLTKLKNKPKA